MPRKELLDRLGSIAFILGNKELPPDISKEDYSSYKSVFSNDVVNSNQSLIDTKISKDDEMLAQLQENDSGISDTVNRKKRDERDDIEPNETTKEELPKPNNTLATKDDTENRENVEKPEAKKRNAKQKKEIKPEPLKEEIAEPNDNASKEKKELDDLDSLLGSLDDILNEDIFDEEPTAPVEEIIDKEDDKVFDTASEGKEDETPLEEIVDETKDIAPIEADSKNIDESLNSVKEENIIETPKEIEETYTPPEATDNNKENNLDDVEDSIDDIKLPDFIEEDDIIAKDEENLKVQAEEEAKKETELKEDIKPKEEPNPVETTEDESINSAPASVLDDNIPSLDDIEKEVDEEIENILEKPEASQDNSSESDDNDSKEVYDTNEKSDENTTKDDITENYPPLLKNGDNELKQDDDDTLAAIALPPPNSILSKSKYGNIASKYDSDKILKNIGNLQEGIQFSVLDAILNETLPVKSMDNLLSVLERNPSARKISNILNSNKISPKQFVDNTKKAISMIPVPEPLREYASVIRYAAILVVGFIALAILAYQFIYKPLRADSYFARGLKYVEDASYETGELNFNRGDRLKPNQTKWFNKYADAYMDKEKFDDAYAKIQKSLSVDAKDFDNRMILGEYYRRRAENDIDKALYDEGEKLYDDILSTEDKKERRISALDGRGLILMSRANTLNEKDYYKKSYDNYQSMLSLYGDNMFVRKRMMQIRIYQDDYEQVKLLKNYIDAMKKNYFDDDVYPILARYLLYKDDFHSARTIYENILKKYKGCLPAIVGYAEYEARLKHYDKARNILQNAALPLYEEKKIKKGKEFVYNLLGQIYYNQTQYGNATREFLNALALNPLYPDANYNLGNVYFYQENNYQKAKEYYQNAFSNMPAALVDDKLMYNLSWIYYLDKEYDRAFEGFLNLFNKASDNVVVSYALANSLMHLDKDVLARGFYNNALTHVLKMRGNLGQLKMRTEKEFALVNYMASLYNNLGVSHAYTYTRERKVLDEQEAFKNFVLSAQYFDQIRTSNIDLQKIEKRSVTLGSQNIAIPTYNMMTMQTRRNLKNTLAIDDYIPKIMNSVK